MSDLLAAAAAALGSPEAMVKRSAEARAKASGMTVDEVLAAWSEGATITAPPPRDAEIPVAVAAIPAAAPPPLQVETVTALPGPAEAEAPISPLALPARPPAPITTRPPVLVGRTDRPFRTLTAATGLFLVGSLLGFVAPVLLDASGEVRSSRIAFTTQAQTGRTVYEGQGCAACHTQMVRPVVADASLGPVSLSDSNLVLGINRIGPDLAHVGSRLDQVKLEGLLGTKSPDHPRAGGLAADDLAALVAYLVESK